MKVILKFKKARFNFDACGYRTLADCSFYGLANTAMQTRNITIDIKRVVPEDSVRYCKIIFTGEDALKEAYEWIDILNNKIKCVKLKVREK